MAETDEKPRKVAKTGEKHKRAVVTRDTASARAKQRAKDGFVAHVHDAAGVLENACRAAGISRMTLWRWRREDAAFDDAVEAAREAATRHIVAQVTDVVTNSALDGNPKMARLFFQVKGLLTEKHEHSVAFTPHLLTGASD